MLQGGLKVAGIILAGGRSSRMAGEDKATALLAGEPLVVRAARRLRPQVAAMALSTNGGAARHLVADADVDPVADADDSRAGPLAGILAGLRWAQALPSPPDALVSVAVDTPFFPRDLVERLAAAAASGPAGATAVAASLGARHPTFALWPLGLAGDLAFYLDGGARRVRGFIERHPHVGVDFAAADGLDPFFNINTQADLAEAEIMMRSLP